MFRTPASRPPRPASFMCLLGRAPFPGTGRRGIENCTQSSIHRAGVLERCGHVGVKKDQVRAAAEARDVLRTHSVAEIVLASHCVSAGLTRLLHRSFARGAWGIARW